MTPLQQEINNARTLQESYNSLSQSYENIQESMAALYAAKYEPNEDGDNHYTMLLPLEAKIEDNTLIV